MIVGDETVRSARVRERKPASRIVVAKQHVSDRRASLIAWIVSHENRPRCIGNTIDYARAPFYQNEHDRLTGSFDGFGQFQLGLTQGQVCEIARRLSISAFPKTNDCHVSVASGTHGFFKIDLMVKRRAGYIRHVLSDLSLDRF